MHLLRNAKVASILPAGYGTVRLGVLLAILVQGCASYDVTSDYDSQADFASYQTFQLMPERALIVSSEAFALESRDRLETTSYPVPYRGQFGWGGVVYQEDVRDYTEGMLSVDVYDVRTRRPVWHGVARKRISNADRGRPELIDAVVAAILKDFPEIANVSR